MSGQDRVTSVQNSSLDWAEWQKYVAQAKQAMTEGNFSYAEVLWSAAVDEAEGEETDQRLPISLDGLAEAFWQQGKLRQAENVARRAFQLYNQILPPDHIDMAVSATNLAMIFHWQQKYGQAEPLYKRALEIKTKHYGANHPEVANVLVHYAKLLQDTHREEEATHLRVCVDGVTTGKWKRTGAMQAIPNRHNISHTQMPMPPGKTSQPPAPKSQPDSATADNTSNRKAQTPDTDAYVRQELEYLRRKVAEYEDTIKKQQIKIEELLAQGALSRSAPPGQFNDDYSLDDKRPWEETMQIARRAFDDRCYDEAHTWLLEALNAAADFGEADPRFATTLDALGESLFNQEKYGQAEMMWQRALNIRRQYLGTYHRDVAMSANNLARLHYNLSRFQEAEFLAQKCIEIYKKLHGDKSLEVASSTNNLATLYHVQGQYAQAERAYKKVVDIRMALLGADHPDTAVVMKKYADMLKITSAPQNKETDEQYTGLITGSWKTLKFDQDDKLGS